MLSICHKHQTVTTWGCRECLRERLGQVVDQSLEQLGADLKRQFSAPPVIAEKQTEKS